MDFVPDIISREEKRRAVKSVLTRLGIGAVTVVQTPALMVAGVEGTAILVSILIAALGAFGTLIAAAGAADQIGWLRVRNRAESIRASINEHYGLSLSPDQFAALSYPRGDPGKEFQTFGSIKVQDQVDGANFLERTLYLTATGGEMKLSESRDGKRFKELKPARHAVEGSTSSPRTALESPRSTIEAQAMPLSVSA